MMSAFIVVLLSAIVYTCQASSLPLWNQQALNYNSRSIHPIGRQGVLIPPSSFRRPVYPNPGRFGMGAGLGGDINGGFDAEINADFGVGLGGGLGPGFGGGMMPPYMGGGVPGAGMGMMPSPMGAGGFGFGGFGYRRVMPSNVTEKHEDVESRFGYLGGHIDGHLGAHVDAEVGGTVNAYGTGTPYGYGGVPHPQYRPIYYQ